MESEKTAGTQRTSQEMSLSTKNGTPPPRDADSLASDPKQLQGEEVKDASGDEKKEEEEADYISGLRLYMVNFAITLAAGLLFLDTAIIATAIPRITDDFKSLGDVGWYAGAYQLGTAAVMPLTGKIFTHFSSKWSFLGFFAVFEIGSVLCGAAVNSPMLIVGRTIAGAGGSGIISGALTIIASSLPLNKRATATGIMMGVSQLGVVLGPLLGGVLTEKSTWRWCFYINLPIGAVCAVIIAFVHIPDQMKKENPLTVVKSLHHYLDLIGFVLFAAATIELLLAFEFGGNQYPWKSSTVIGLFCGSAATFAVWSAWNWHKKDDALIPVSMMSIRAVWSSSLAQAFSMVTLFIVTYFLPIYFQAVKKASPISSGVQMLPSIISQLIFAVLSGVLVSKTGFAIPYFMVGASLGAIGCGLLTTLAPDSSLGEWFGYQVLSGVGRGLAMQMPIIAMQASLKPSQVSTANSLMVFTQSLFVSILVIVGNTILDGSIRSDLSFLSKNDVEKVVMAGATEFRSVTFPDVPKSEMASTLTRIILAYSDSIAKVFYIGVAAGILSFLFSPGMGWVDIRKKGPKAASTPKSDESTMEAGEKSREASGEQPRAEA